MPSKTSSDAAPAAASPFSSPAFPASPWDAFGAAGDRLARIAAGSRIASAYLFESADAAGPRAAARVFAAALLCEAAPGPAADRGGRARPCGACSTCRRVRAGSHPDVHRRGRDKPTVISVDALAALLERAHASPREGRRQVFVIDPADAMAPEAVARYLKSLEEPPATTTFVLVTTRPDRLTDAVRSRCQRVRFADPSVASIEARLVAERVEPARAALVARWSNGAVARAQRLAAIEADFVVDQLATAALGSIPTAATSVESVLATLRARAGASSVTSDAADEDRGSADGGPAADVAPGERLREAIEDVFHALMVACRDRVADRGASGVTALDRLSPARAAAALERLVMLAGYVRRNVTPGALLLDAVFALRAGASAARESSVPR